MIYRKSYNALGSPTGFLLAANSFFELLHQSSHFCFLAVAASGTNLIPLRVAFYIEVLPLFGFNASSSIGLLSLSFDRLFALAAPFRWANFIAID
jgi:hypothetical protein